MLPYYDWRGFGLYPKSNCLFLAKAFRISPHTVDDKNLPVNRSALFHLPKSGIPEI
jgi:hypothetical protein